MNTQLIVAKTKKIVEPSFGKKVVSSSFTLVAFIGLGALGWFAMEERRNNDAIAMVPVIKASPTPFKIQPKDPGGMEIPHKDKMIFNTIATHAGGQQDVIDMSRTQLLPPPEEPVSKEVVKTMPKPKQLDVAEPLINKPEPVMDKAEENVATIEKPAEIKQPSEKVIRLAELPRSPKRKLQERTTNKIASTKPSAGKVQRKFKTGDSGSIRIQLGAYRDKESLEKGWYGLQKKFPEELGNLHHAVEIADLGSRGRFYRLHASGIADKNTAQALCNRLAAKNQACLIPK